MPLSILLIYCPVLLIAAATSSCVSPAAFLFAFKNLPNSVGLIKTEPSFQINKFIYFIIYILFVKVNRIQKIHFYFAISNIAV